MALKQNIIYIYFKGKHQVTSKSQYQYNRGQYLYFADLNLPQAFEVHFSNKDKGESKTQIGSDNLVEIPDEYFWNGALQIYAWIYLHSKTTDGETIYEVRIPLTKRAKPTDEEPLPVQQSTIDRAIAELNNAIDITTENANKTDSDKIIVSNIKEDVVTLKDEIDSTATTINQKAQETIDASERAETSAQNAATSENKALNYSQQAEQSAQSALESKNVAQQKSEVATNASNEALGYRNEALEAKTQAVQAKQNIVDYRNETKGYRDETLNLKNTVQTLKNQIDETASEIDETASIVRDNAESANRSASSANESASHASASASASANSASQSAQIKADVEDLADDARGYAQSAEQSAQNAHTYALSANAASSTAENFADVASGYASQAQSSAQTASAKAQDASQSASTASQKATESAQSASQALSYKTDAESAKTASQTAQGLAESARDSAVQAKTDAESAKADAETARDAVQSSAAQITTNAEDITQLKEGLSAIQTATESDVGKALKAKTVTDGKVTEWEFGEAGGSVTVDSALDVTSENPVQNKTLYNELNIFTSSADDIVYVNNGTNETSVYSGSIATIEFPTSNPLTLKEVDVCVASGNVARLGIWSLRRATDDTSSVNYHRGYFTLEQELGTVTASNNHAVFTLNNLSIDPTSTEQILIVSCASNKIGAHSNVVNNLMPMWYTSNYGFSETAVGAENSTALWYKSPTGNYGVQSAYKVTYTQGGTVTATPVKTVVQNLESDVSAINTATSADIGKALVVDSVTDGKATFAFESVGGGGSSDASGSAYTEGTFRTPVNKYFCVIVDDVTADALTVADQLLAIGIKPAFALKMESMGSEITWDNVKRLQDLGFEICFHGMLHSHTPAGTAPANDSVMIADIAEYKALCKEHGIVLHGYAGPNHYPLPVGAFKEFEWARTPYGLQGYGGGNHLTTTFASVIVWSCDPVNNAVPTSTMIAAANTLSDNQYLTPMLHCQNLVTYLNDYLTVFNSWISAGLTPLRPMDAVKQSLFNSGGIGNNSTFEIQAGTASNPYNMIAGNGIQHMDDTHGYYTKTEVDAMVGDVETLLASI